MWSSRAPSSCASREQAVSARVGRRLRQLACEQLPPRTRGRASASRPPPSRAAPRSAPRPPPRAGPAGGGTRRWRRAARVASAGACSNGRSPAQRTTSRLGADVAQRRRRLLRLAREQLVDEHHRTLAGLDLRCADQVQAPARGDRPSRGTMASRTPTSRVPATPRRPVRLLLPERNALLQGVDRLVAGGQRLGAVWRRHGDDHARLADLDPADAMVDRDGSGQLVASGDLRGNLLHHGLGHACVGLVEVENLAPARAATPHRAGERRDRARLLRGHLQRPLPRGRAVRIDEGGTRRRRRAGSAPPRRRPRSASSGAA